MRMLDLFCGRFGWGRVFAENGWDVVGIDLVRPPEVPEGCEFIKADILGLTFEDGQWVLRGAWQRELKLGNFDFGCASSPCEQFSIHGMKHFHPNPPFPEIGLKLFNHTRGQIEKSGMPYIMENVRAAQQFVGNAIHHCGPFYLWGNSVPPIMPKGITKGFQTGGTIIQKLKCIDRQALTEYRRQNDLSWSSSGSKKRREFTALAATIPPELAKIVAHYAEGLYAQSRGLVAHG